MSKHDYASSMNQNRNGGKALFKYGLVISNQDENGAKRIIVRVNGDDDGLTNEELPTAFPLLPKLVNILPKVNEMVLIFLADPENTRSDRFYIGPLISQPQNTNFSNYLTAKSALQSGQTPLYVNPDIIPDAKGVYSNNEDLVLEGRNNADVVFNDSEIKIRVGKYTDKQQDGVPLFNFKNPTYIQLKHNTTVNESNVKFSMINMVSDKIFLLTHENGSPRFNLNDQENQIPDDSLLDILMNAHPLPFGDKLIEYLNLLKTVILNHSHPYSGMKAFNLNGEDSIEKLNNFDVTTILSKNIKIN